MGFRAPSLFEGDEPSAIASKMDKVWCVSDSRLI